MPPYGNLVNEAVLKHPALLWLGEMTQRVHLLISKACSAPSYFSQRLDASLALFSITETGNELPQQKSPLFP